jgi:RNA polymerase sigma-70 factor (ECF subfamily)
MKELSKEIVSRAAEGSIEAFEQIYRAYSRFVYHVAYRVVNEVEEAEEIAQDVFLTVYRKLGTFGHKSSFKTWIYRIAVNTAINHAKKISKEQQRSVAFDNTMEWHLSVDPWNEKIDRDHREQIVSALLSALNSDQRACLVLRDLEGLSYEEIAETLETNINTVRSRLKRGRERLLALSKEVAKNEM